MLGEQTLVEISNDEATILSKKRLRSTHVCFIRSAGIPRKTARNSWQDIRPAQYVHAHT